MNPLTDLRKRLKLSQAELGLAIGVGQSVVSMYERGDCQMGVDKALKLVAFARARGVKVKMESLYVRVAPQQPEVA
jgi:transcriptional regulator with XRE-family HTH domain